MSLPDTSSNDFPFFAWSRDVSVYIAVLWWNDGDLSFLVRLTDPYSPHHWKIYQGCFFYCGNLSDVHAESEGMELLLKDWILHF